MKPETVVDVISVEDQHVRVCRYRQNKTTLPASHPKLAYFSEKH